MSDRQQREDVAVLNAATTQATARRLVKRARYARVNRRRAELIYRHDDLTAEESAELEQLQEVCFRLTSRAYPLPLIIPASPTLPSEQTS